MVDKEPADSAAPRTSAKSRRDRLKLVAFRLLALLIVVGAIELMSYVALRVMHAENLKADVTDYLAGTAKSKRLSSAEYRPLRGIGPDFDEVLHPYVGFVVTASDPAKQDLADLGWAQPVLFKKSPERVIVAITGGSVARQIYELAGDVLRAELLRSPRFQGKKLELLDLSLGGYKQPQQLMILNYLLTLGGEFDIIINLDGFNEVALHEAENGAKGVFPSFPRWWQDRVNDVVSADERVNIGELAYLLRQLDLLGRSRTLRFLSHFQTGKLWRAFRIKSLYRDIDRVVQASTSPASGSATRYLASGPRWKFDEDELYEHLTQIWSRASLEMHYLSRANGIKYYHFLQPNQYVEGSKPMGEDERRHAYDPHMRYRPGAVKGYPKLIAAGQKLRAQGVAYTDLTQLFAAEKARVYDDTCCHFLASGAASIARKIASVILADTAN